jgi:effector-binding domain-containing protein
MKRGIALIAGLAFAASLALAQTDKPAAGAADKKGAEVKSMSKTEQVGEIKVKEFPAMTAAVVHLKAADYAPAEGYKAGMEGVGEAYTKMMTSGFGALGAWAGQSSVKPNGPAFAMYFEDPEKTAAKDLTSTAGFQVPAEAKGNDKVKIETIPAMNAATVQFKGPYEGSGEIWMALDKWIGEHGYVQDGPGMEVYLKGMGDTQKPEEFLTEIRQSVKKAEGKTAPKADEKKMGATTPATGK